MPLLPRPFAGDKVSSPLVPSPSFLTGVCSSPTAASHFPPWYSGSKTSQLHQVLSQNRTVQLGVPALWTSKEIEEDSLTQTIPQEKVLGNDITNRNVNRYQGPPGRKSFYCDTCDRSFVTQDELDDHSSMHIMCSIGGCKFQAHPKVVALHKRMQHATGLAKKIMNLDTPEDIKKWREERKRNFPTVANVERKLKEQEAKTERGEVLDNKFFGKMRRNEQGLQRGNESHPQQQLPRYQRGRGRNRNNRGRSWGHRRMDETRQETNDGPVKSTSLRNPSSSLETQSGHNDPSKAESVTSKPQNMTLKEPEDCNGRLKRFRGSLFDYSIEVITENVESEVVANGHKRRRRGRRNASSPAKQNTCSESVSEIVSLDTDDSVPNGRVTQNSENVSKDPDMHSENVCKDPDTHLESVSKDLDRLLENVSKDPDMHANLPGEKSEVASICSDSSAVAHKNICDNSVSPQGLSPLKEIPSALKSVPTVTSSHFTGQQKQTLNTLAEPVKQNGTENNLKFASNKDRQELTSRFNLATNKSEVIRPNVNLSTDVKTTSGSVYKPTSSKTDEIEEDKKIRPTINSATDNISKPTSLSTEHQECKVVRPNGNPANDSKERKVSVSKCSSSRTEELEEGELESSDEEPEPLRNVAPLHFFTANPQDDSDEEGRHQERAAPAEIVIQRIGGSLSLLAGYGSDSDSGVEEEKVPVAPSAPKVPASVPKVPSVPTRPIPDLYPVPKTQQKGKKKLSLLEKLLSDEIRHERNIVLQCVYHTVKNDFYDTK